MVVFTIVNKLTENILNVNVNILNVNKSMCLKKIKKWYKRKSRQINETTIRQKCVNKELWIAGVLLVRASNDYGKYQELLVCTRCEYCARAELSGPYS